jgi:hypothetical protein
MKYLVLLLVSGVVFYGIRLVILKFLESVNFSEKMYYQASIYTAILLLAVDFLFLHMIFLPVIIVFLLFLWRTYRGNGYD